MRCLGFESPAEVYVYATCVMLGIAMLMPLQALTSAPAYMVNYYKYVTGNEHAVPSSKLFWGNILTFYNLVSVPTQVIVGPTVLMPWARKLSLTTRFIGALSLMMVEILVIMVMPAGGQVSQTGAIVAFVIVTIAAGAGKSYLEATCYALVGTMHPKFMSAIMFGCGCSGVIASTIQCIIKASMASDHHTVQLQAYIYFALAMSFIVVSMVMAICLRYNSYAQEYVGEYRMLARVRRTADGEQDLCEGRADTANPYGRPMSATEPHADGRGHAATAAAATTPNGPMAGELVFNDGVNDAQSPDGVAVMAAGERGNGKEVKLAAGDEDDAVHAVNLRDGAAPTVPMAGDDESTSEDAAAQMNMTTAEQMQSTRVMPVIKAIYPMMIGCFTIFLVTLYIFPSLVIPIDRTDPWFATIAFLIYNCGDATGRFSSSVKFIWPSRKVLLIVSACRFAFIPVFFMCIYHYIPSHVAPCVFMGALGLTNGFFGGCAMVFGPLTAGLHTDGQRVMAGQLMGISLLAGASAAALLGMLTVLFLPTS